MQDFARLAFGILLLGLAIFLSLNFENPETADNQEDDELVQVDANPNWQQNQPPDYMTQPRHDPSIVAPNFDVAATTPAFNTRPARPLPLGQQPPSFTDHYAPGRPLVVQGQLRPDSSNLSPVMPKPTYTGRVSYVSQLHTIQDGDTLQSIATQYLGHANRYLEIYDANKDIISIAGRLPIGVEIRIPGQ